MRLPLSFSQTTPADVNADQPDIADDPTILIITGVSGSGKTTIAIALDAGVCAGCRSGRLQGSPELIPEEGSPPGFDIVYPETRSEKCR